MTVLNAETAIAQQNHIIEKIFDCNKRNLEQVESLLIEIETLVRYYIKAPQTSYLVGATEQNESDEAHSDGAEAASLSPRGLQLLQKSSSPFLVSLLSKPPLGVQNESEWMDRISNLMALICGRIAVGQSTTSFEFPNSGQILIHETSFTDAEIGFQTWGAGILLAKMIDDGLIKVKNQDILELGSGTGLSGLVSGKMGGRTVMTDYHPVVIQNAIKNIERNSLQDFVQCIELDWRWFLPGHQHELEDKADPQLSKKEWRTIIAADCIFDLSHSQLVPKVAKHYLSNHQDSRFHCLLPHRLQFKNEISSFESNMVTEGWIMEYNQWIEKHSLTLRYYVFRKATPLE